MIMHVLEWSCGTKQKLAYKNIAEQFGWSHLMWPFVCSCKDSFNRDSCQNLDSSWPSCLRDSIPHVSITFCKRFHNLFFLKCFKHKHLCNTLYVKTANIKTVIILVPVKSWWLFSHATFLPLLFRVPVRTGDILIL